MQVGNIQYSYNVLPLYPNFTYKQRLFNKKQAVELEVFLHHIYEYKHGLRNLVLTTQKAANRTVITEKLNRENINYLIQQVDEKKINVFFGTPQAVNVIKSFEQPRLNKYTPEQDFILGTLLGYNQVQQCERFLKYKQTGRL